MRNLKIEELFLGAYVCVFRDGMMSAPMRVTDIRGDGCVILEGVEGIVSVSLRDICPVQMDEGVMRGFRFHPTKGDNVWMKQRGDIRLTVALKWKGGIQQCRRCAISGRTACWNEEIRYVHELQRWWNDRVYFPFDVEMELEWKGVPEKIEEL